MSMPSILKRHGRVMCAQCGASHPAIFEGQQCVICGSAIDTASRPHNDVDTVEPENHEAEEQHKVESDALNAERAELSATLAALTRQEVVSSDYDPYVKLAAKGMAERDNYPMPRSVTTPKAFYEIMAGAALDAVGLQSLLGQLERANQQLEITRKLLRLTETHSEDSPTSDD